MKPHLAFIDLETTGLDPSKHEIIEVAIIIDKGDGTALLEWETKIKPENLSSAHPKALEINGYSEEEWADAPTLGEVSDRIVALLSGTIPVAHNAHFDRGFLETHLGVENVPHRWLDTISIAHVVLPNRNKYSLGSLCDLYGINNAGAHRALPDARRCKSLYEELMRQT